MKADSDRADRYQKILRYVMAAVAFCYMIFLRFVPTAPQYKAILYTMIVLVFTFAVKRGRFLAVDILLMGMAVISMGYLLVNYSALMVRITSANKTEGILAVVALITIWEATRRTTGYPLLIISMLFLAYGFLGPYMPGLLWHRGFSLSRFAQNMYITTSGFFGSATQAASGIIIAFIAMGELMLNCGAGDLFTKAAGKITGKMTAGTAKMSIIAGLLFGMINGSAAANVVTTGQFTIPMMKKEGYSSEYAGAISAVSSTGGALSPPVMGAGAFLLAEYCGISYASVCKAAIMPAFFYYLSIFLCVHYEAKKMERLGTLKLVDRSEEAPTEEKKVSMLLEYCHILLPLTVLVILIVIAYPILYACYITIGLMIVMGLLNPFCKFDFDTLVNTFYGALKGSLSVGAACACSGIIVCVIGTTGLGVSFAAFVLKSGVPLLVAMFFTMLILILLGMGLPGISAYIVGSSVAASVLLELGVPLVSAHLFIYYFSCLAVLTPPVALTAYAAASISGGDPVKTGIKSVLLAVAGFLAPYVFALDPALILQAAPLSCIYRIVLTGIGVTGLALAITGYFRNTMSVFTRFLLVMGALAAIYPAPVADALGLVLVVGGLLMNMKADKTQNTLAKEGVCQWED